MADAKISALTELTAPSKLDEAAIVDKDDTTDAASGTTKRITVDNLSKYAPDARIIGLIPMIENGALLDQSTFVRNGSNALTSATIKWSRRIPGATDGAYSGTAHGTFTGTIDTWTATYPDGTDDNNNTTLSVDYNYDSDGLPNPNAPAMS